MSYAKIVIVKKELYTDCELCDSTGILADIAIVDGNKVLIVCEMCRNCLIRHFGAKLLDKEEEEEE